MRLRALIGTLAILLAGCSQASQVVTERDAGRTVTLHAADTITLDLQDSWGPPGVSLTWHAITTNGSVLQLDSVEDPGLHISSLGGPGNQQVVQDFHAHFRAGAAGTAQIVAHGTGTCEAMAVCHRDRDITITVVVT